MKIIKIGKILTPKKFVEIAKCVKCNTVVEFDKNECQRISYGSAWSMTPPYCINFYYITCPHCGNGNFSGYSKEIT